MLFLSSGNLRRYDRATTHFPRIFQPEFRAVDQVRNDVFAVVVRSRDRLRDTRAQRKLRPVPRRSEEHTSELQSLAYLVCRLLLEKKKKKIQKTTSENYRIRCTTQI